MSDESTTTELSNADKLTKVYELDDQIGDAQKLMEERDGYLADLGLTLDLARSIRGAKNPGAVKSTNGTTTITRPRLKPGDPDPTIITKWKSEFGTAKSKEIKTDTIRAKAVDWKVSPEVALGSLMEVAEKQGVTAEWKMKK